MKTHSHLSYILTIAFSLLSDVALATHEIDHRYNVKGFVLDENEEAVSGSPVSIRLGNSVIGYQETNSQGYYNIRLHLHDADLGKKLKVRTAVGEGTIRVTFMWGDKTTRRVHYANFIGGKLVERRLARMPFSIWGYASAAATLMIISTAIVVGNRIKRRRKRQLRRAEKHKKRQR